MEVIDQTVLTDLDHVLMNIEKMDEEELKKIEEAIKEQRALNEVQKSRKLKLQQLLRDERVKIESKSKRKQEYYEQK